MKCLNRPWILGDLKLSDSTLMKSKQYLIEVNNLAVELLIESHKDYPSLWAARQPIAPKFECNSETLRTWHQKHLANLDWVHWYNHERVHSTNGYVSPERGLAKHCFARVQDVGLCS